MLSEISENKQPSRQQRSAANSTTASGLSLPAVSVLQPKSNDKVRQLYTTEKFGKLSERRQMLLQSNYKLFASGSKIQQANGIGGDVGFKAGENHEQIEGLKEVHAFVKPGSKLETDMKDYKPSEEFKQVRPNAIARLPDRESLTDKYKDIILQHTREDEPLPVEVSSRVGERNLKESREDRISLLKELVEASLEELRSVERPLLEKKIDDYLLKQQELKHRPLMPSDCKAMSSYVAGFVAGIGDEDVTHLPVEAGDVYEYNAPDAQKAEWPFHYATVIMTDGGDHVTMENAAAKESDKFSKMQYDHSWFFEMYGTGKGQTFDDHYKPMLDPD